MFTVAPQSWCSRARLGRRALLRAGSLGTCGLTLPVLFAAGERRSPNDHSFGRAKRCVLLFLTGGPPQHDTWDMKPEAAAEFRGELTPIATSVPGIEISELFPLLAGQAHRYCLVRSVTHDDTVHTSAGYAMLTGFAHPTPNLANAALVGPQPNDHPHIGSVVAKARGWTNDVPPFVSLPEVIKDAAINEFPGQGAGFLGESYGPFCVEADEARTRLEMPNIALPTDVSPRRFAARRTLLDRLAHRSSSSDANPPHRDLDGHYQQAYALIASEKARQAFRLDREPSDVRAAYGGHLFGQGCLLARRLLEAGVDLVTVYWHYEGPDDSPVWDTHWNNFPHLRQRLMPPTDRAISALLADMDDRGLLDDTLVACFGEFGRSPRINSMGGRDHWPRVQSIMLAGAGIPGGTVYGASDRQGGAPESDPVIPSDLSATLLHLLGVPPQMELHDLFGRPLLASTGEPLRRLIG